MFALHKDTKGELSFRPYKQSSKTETVDVPINIPIVRSSSNNHSYTSWIDMNIDTLMNIEERLYEDMYKVIQQNDIPIKIFVDNEKFREMLYRKIYNTSYNTSKKWVEDSGQDD